MKDIESHLRRLSEQTPSSEARDRVRMQLRSSLPSEHVLQRTSDALQPDTATQARVKATLRRQIHQPVQDLLSKAATTLSPASGLRSSAWQMIAARLNPSTTTHRRHIGAWVAAVLVLALGVRMSPSLLFAPPTVAESSALLLPTGGQTQILSQGLWQPVYQETSLQRSVRIRTLEGESTVMLHDDGNVRLAEYADVFLSDVSDRPDPATSHSTVTLNEGRVWVQGLVPESVRGIVVSTPHGELVVHGGSVSVTVGTLTDIRVWDRSVVVLYRGQEMTLVAGEQIQLWEDSIPRVQSIASEMYSVDWVKQNLARDAAHRREIAQLQQERRAAQAGILPTSPLYTVKRVAEKVDVFLTINPEQRVQKQIAQASTRLNEAAALIAQGDEQATVPLSEYREVVREIASGTGSDAAHMLLAQELTQDTAELAAALPDDSSYVLKKAVLEAQADVSATIESSAIVDNTIVTDALGLLREAIQEGDSLRIEQSLLTLEPYVGSVLDEESPLKPEVRKEAVSLLSRAEASLSSESVEGTGSLVLDTLSGSNLIEKEEPVVHYTQREVDGYAQRIMRRVDVYDLSRPRWNQLYHELQKIEGHVDEGSILRSLLHLVPDEEDSLIKLIEDAMRDVRLRMQGPSA